MEFMDATVELSRFKVKLNKSEKVTEWLEFLNKNIKDVLLTLDNEKMYIETIFREISDEGEYLYWYSIQGNNHSNVEDSESYIDKKHIEYWNECIDESFKNTKIVTSVHMINNKIFDLLKEI